MCPHDEALHRSRKPVFHVLRSATLDEALDAIERPEDCVKPCWRHVDGGSQCECDDETEGGVWGPGS